MLLVAKLVPAAGRRRGRRSSDDVVAERPALRAPGAATLTAEAAGHAPASRCRRQRACSAGQQAGQAAKQPGRACAAHVGSEKKVLLQGRLALQIAGSGAGAGRGSSDSGAGAAEGAWPGPASGWGDQEPPGPGAGMGLKPGLKLGLGLSPGLAPGLAPGAGEAPGEDGLAVGPPGMFTVMSIGEPPPRPPSPLGTGTYTVPPPPPPEGTGTYTVPPPEGVCTRRGVGRALGCASRSRRDGACQDWQARSGLRGTHGRPAALLLRPLPCRGTGLTGTGTTMMPPPPPEGAGGQPCQPPGSRGVPGTPASGGACTSTAGRSTARGQHGEGRRAAKGQPACCPIGRVQRSPASYARRRPAFASPLARRPQTAVDAAASRISPTLQLARSRSPASAGDLARPAGCAARVARPGAELQAAAWRAPSRPAGPARVASRRRCGVGASQRRPAPAPARCPLGLGVASRPRRRHRAGAACWAWGARCPPAAEATS